MMNPKELRIQREKIRTMIDIAKKLGGAVDVDGDIVTVEELIELLKELDEQIAIESSKLDNLQFMPNRSRK
jgi:hypothetical protein